MPKIDDYSFELGPMGAVGEQGSLLLRINRNCPWNRCLFCSAYKGRSFEYRPCEEIKRDISVIRTLSHQIQDTVRPGADLRSALGEVVSANPRVYGEDAADEDTLERRFRCLSHVAHWLTYGGKTVFLQDADALITRSPELVEVLQRLKDAFPSIERITSYSRSKTCSRKSAEELKALKEAGLSRVLIGLESGSDRVLEYVQKGATAKDHVQAGRNIRDAGIYLAEFVMPGLGGAEMSDEHVAETVRVLNDVKPDLLRLRSLAIQRRSPLYERYERGELQQPSDDQMVDEIESLVKGLDFECEIETGQLTNILFEIRGELPRDRDEILSVIGRYKAMSKREKLKFRVSRYSRYYLPYIIDRGHADFELEDEFEDALEAVERGSPDAEAKVEAAIMDMKSRGIP